MYVMIMMVRSGMGPTLLLPAATGPVKRTDADQPADQLAGQTGQRQPPTGRRRTVWVLLCPATRTNLPGPTGHRPPRGLPQPGRIGRRFRWTS